MTPAQQGHGDPGKSVAGREMVDEAVIDTEDLKAAGHAAEEARDGEGDEDRAGEVDANRPCEPRVEARHAELVADPRATEKVGIKPGDQEGDDEGDRKLARRQQRAEPGLLRD